MQPFQDRVISERAELELKTGALGNFLFGPLFNNLPTDEQLRMVKQYAYMKLYLEVLGERIAAFV